MVHKENPKCKICGKACGCSVPYRDCFRPRKQPRYIKYMVPNLVWKKDLEDYNIHLQRIYQAKSIVDTRPPSMNVVNQYLPLLKFQRDNFRMHEIDRNNRKMVKKIIEIYRTRGKTDTINENAFLKLPRLKDNEPRMIEIDKHNRKIYEALRDATPYYTKREHSSEWHHCLRSMKILAKFPLQIFKKTNLDELLASEPTISGNLEKYSDRPECFIEFQVEGGEHLGRLIISLYIDHVPVTVQNFIEILTGSQNLSYKGCPVHRIVKNKYLETGDITKGTGTGGFSIYGETFDEENHTLMHTKAGVLSMARIGTSEKNNSRFCITFANMQQWDKKNVVFGKVIRGVDVLNKLNCYGRKVGKPLNRIYISRCGLLPESQYSEEEFI